MKLRPVLNNVVIEPEAAETMKGGFYIPESAQEKPAKGVVLAVGPGYVDNGVLVEVPVKEGDVVVYGKFAGADIEIGGKKVKVIKAHDIYAVVDTEE